MFWLECSASWSVTKRLRYSQAVWRIVIAYVPDEAIKSCYCESPTPLVELFVNHLLVHDYPSYFQPHVIVFGVAKSVRPRASDTITSKNLQRHLLPQDLFLHERRRDNEKCRAREIV